MRQAFKLGLLGLAACLLAALSACGSLAPDYHAPKANAPAQWQEAPTEPGWQAAEPRDSEAKGAWWKIFNDPVLNALADATLAHNPSLAQAQFRLERPILLILPPRLRLSKV